MSTLDELVLKIAEEREAAIENILLPQVIAFSVPAIKGGLTRGKIKWRGLRMIVQQDINGDIVWFEQRGKPVTQKIQFKLNFT